MNIVLYYFYLRAGNRTDCFWAEYISSLSSRLTWGQEKPSAGTGRLDIGLWRGRADLNVNSNNAPLSNVLPVTHCIKCVISKKTTWAKRRVIEGKKTACALSSIH